MTREYIHEKKGLEPQSSTQAITVDELEIPYGERSIIVLRRYDLKNGCSFNVVPGFIVANRFKRIGQSLDKDVSSVEPIEASKRQDISVLLTQNGFREPIYFWK